MLYYLQALILAVLTSALYFYPEQWVVVGANIIILGQFFRATFRPYTNGPNDCEQWGLIGTVLGFALAFWYANFQTVLTDLDAATKMMDQISSSVMLAITTTLSGAIYSQILQNYYRAIGGVTDDGSS